MKLRIMEDNHLNLSILDEIFVIKKNKRSRQIDNKLMSAIKVVKFIVFNIFEIYVVLIIILKFKIKPVHDNTQGAFSNNSVTEGSIF